MKKEKHSHAIDKYSQLLEEIRKPEKPSVRVLKEGEDPGKKVYCIFCRNLHFNYGRYCGIWSKKQVDASWFSAGHSSSILNTHNPSEKNRNNNCRDYKRKWYLSWR